MGPDYDLTQAPRLTVVWNRDDVSALAIHSQHNALSAFRTIDHKASVLGREAAVLLQGVEIGEGKLSQTRKLSCSCLDISKTGPPM